MDKAVTSKERAERALAALAEKPDGVVEAIAAQADVSPAEILALLPAGASILVPSEHFLAIWQDMASWGDVLMIVHTDDIVLEVEGALPQGSEGLGWFNIHGDSPIGGHIRKDRCVSIAFVDRGFHGRRSCSVMVHERGRPGHVQGLRPSRCGKGIAVRPVAAFRSAA